MFVALICSTSYSDYMSEGSEVSRVPPGFLFCQNVVDWHKRQENCLALNVIFHAWTI